MKHSAVLRDFIEKVMSTFERAKRNLLADMAACKVHTAESWANIMLRNTARLTSEQDQAKFWSFMTNPDDNEDVPAPVLEPANHTMCTQDPTVVCKAKADDDEKGGEMEVEIENSYHREGMTMFIQSRPKSNQEESVPLLAGLSLSEQQTDEQTVIEIS